MTTEQLLELSRNRLASLEQSRRALWATGDENAVIDIDAQIAAVRSRIAELEANK